MKLKELKFLLNGLDNSLDDFDVELDKVVLGKSDWGIDIESYEITKDVEIGYSNKIICLGLEKIER